MVILAHEHSPDILVTGATGFLGTHIVRRLVTSGYRVRVLARSHNGASHFSDIPVRCVIGDVADLRVMVEAVRHADAVVYAAGVTSVSVDRGLNRSHAVNVVGIQNIIDASRILGATPRLIVIGTQSGNPGVYARTKREGEQLALASGLDVTVIRPALVYGPDWRSVFGRMVAMVKRLPLIPIVGSGRYEMAPIYVEDVAVAVARCLEHGMAREVYLSGPDRITYKQFMGMIARALERRPLFLHVPYPVTRFAVRMVTGVWPAAPISLDTLLGLIHGPAYAHGVSVEQMGISVTPLEHGLRKTFQVFAARSKPHRVLPP